MSGCNKEALCVHKSLVCEKNFGKTWLDLTWKMLLSNSKNEGYFCQMKSHNFFSLTCFSHWFFFMHIFTTPHTFLSPFLPGLVRICYSSLVFIQMGQNKFSSDNCAQHCTRVKWKKFRWDDVGGYPAGQQSTRTIINNSIFITILSSAFLLCSFTQHYALSLTTMTCLNEAVLELYSNKLDAPFFQQMLTSICWVVVSLKLLAIYKWIRLICSNIPSINSHSGKETHKIELWVMGRPESTDSEEIFRFPPSGESWLLALLLFLPHHFLCAYCIRNA